MATIPFAVESPVRPKETCGARSAVSTKCGIAGGRTDTEGAKRRTQYRREIDALTSSSRSRPRCESVSCWRNRSLLTPMWCAGRSAVAAVLVEPIHRRRRRANERALQRKPAGSDAHLTRDRCSSRSEDRRGTDSGSLCAPRMFRSAVPAPTSSPGRRRRRTALFERGKGTPFLQEEEVNNHGEGDGGMVSMMALYRTSWNLDQVRRTGSARRKGLEGVARPSRRARDVRGAG